MNSPPRVVIMAREIERGCADPDVGGPIMGGRWEEEEMHFKPYGITALVFGLLIGGAVPVGVVTAAVPRDLPQQESPDGEAASVSSPLLTGAAAEAMVMPVQVPEPATLALVVMGAGSLLLLHRGRLPAHPGIREGHR